MVWSVLKTHPIHLVPVAARVPTVSAINSLVNATATRATAVPTAASPAAPRDAMNHTVTASTVLASVPPASRARLVKSKSAPITVLVMGCVMLTHKCASVSQDGVVRIAGRGPARANSRTAVDMGFATTVLANARMDMKELIVQ